MRVARRVKIETPAEISLREMYPEEDVRVLAVGWELSDAFWNVLKNGAQAMLPEGGVLSVDVKQFEKENEPFVEIVIHNQGSKIPRDIIHQIFEPFYSTKESGTGYGLWRTQLVIQEIEGSISIENVKDGVETRIILPTLIE
ncbi:MAG: hypothetical protein GF364_22575 [Candidatus Lokiarchaeota archaeon]|nr:hypothetical protein [Candidatus Lokiarchaeota archaeon]